MSATNASRRKPKSQRRASRRAAAQQRAQQRRMPLWGGSAFIVALVIVLGLIIFNRNEASAPASTIAYDTIPTDGRVLGEPDAPVEFVVYSVFQCPFCKQFDERDLPQVVDDFVT